jgi:hypothetical protein
MNEQAVPSSITNLGDYQIDCRELDEAAFKERHGDLFFLHHGPIGKLNQAGDGQRTIALEGRGTSPGVPLDPRADFVVFRVPPKRQGALGDDLLWLGRSEENDVVIPDVSVSAIHAFLRLDPDGRVLMHDSGSRNGTQVEDEPVPSPGMGAPAVLESGARLVVGEVKLTFLRAAEFRSLIQQLLG